MAFELEVTESVEAGIRRIADEQLASALDDLRTADPKKADTAIHSARKRLKRIRALVRLVREQLGEEIFARENTCFRDAGGSLSEARDAAVLIATLDTLKDAVEASIFAAHRRKLLARRRAIQKRVLEAGDGLETVARTVEDSRQRVGQWTIPADGWTALKPGLKRIYREGRAAFDCATIGGRPELFHEWRKRVKDLWHQLEVLEEVWPEVIKGLADESHALAETLGKEHDLAVLNQVLQAEALVQAQAESDVVEIVELKRLELQQEARVLGAKLFAEKPGAFVKRLGKYWAAWKRTSATDVRQEAPVELLPQEAPLEIPVPET